MDSGHGLVKADTILCRIEPIDSEHLFGPGYMIVYHVPFPTTDMTQFLRQSQETFTFTQGLLRLLTFRDVKIDTNHSQWLTVFIPNHATFGLEKSNCTVRPAHPILRLKMLMVNQGVLYSFFCLLAIIRKQQGCPGFIGNTKIRFLNPV